jgi:phosphate uptake regulator
MSQNRRELRKVQETGGTFFISIPKPWARRSGLEKGSVVEVIQREDGRLVVDPHYGLVQNNEVATISSSPLLEREITGKYLLGYNTIQIEGPERLSLKTFERTRTTVRRLIGLEIVEEDAERIIVQCLLDPSAFPPEKVLRREYLFASSMHKDAQTALIEGNACLAASIIERDDEVDRLYFLIVRLLRAAILNPRLAEKMGIPLIACLDYRIVASHIEAIADHVTAIANSVRAYFTTPLPSDVLTRLHRLCSQSATLHERAIRAFFLSDLNLVLDVLAEKESLTALFSEVDQLLSGKSPDVIAYASNLVSSLRQILESTADLADIVMTI